ncbi:dihydroorotate dehydrogenase (fumarate) [Propionibacterium sp. oral taxon 192 str. F0372]|uniref:quinone-dependent dihydroorotate dehydrogenase n=1 Tax=Propionibacterium sp. oral taxon 192 TaxID=671222 RepID=UPI000353255F|nr:quinone-dependent dihydroorotate dehydrogenase [Propionibacterium sp. oral taxon 192]EPH02770.1 dihydroorotate dehydrogenase (fumarate) [Propionibacterium sp. oral taxon 192 str. F0372]
MVTVDELLIRTLRAGYAGCVRPVLFRLNGGDPEEIHHQMVGVLGELPASVLDVMAQFLASSMDPVTVAGIDFPGRVGVAAGLDKDGMAARAWAAMGYGFAELGTVTAKAQPGNKAPRLFRLPHSQAIINRMGFNNSGVEAMAARLDQWGVYRGNGVLGHPIGVSIGKTKTTALDAANEDYLHSLRTIAPHADYVAINVSSPNTEGLRSLQSRRAVESLTSALVEETVKLDSVDPIPLFVKLAPDLVEADLTEVLAVCAATGVSGIIATNTTITRDGLHASERHLASQAGGLSGAPLTAKALAFVESIASRTELPIMGSGGIMTPRDAQRLFDAGSQLVQVYTGFIYSGPALVMGINRLCVPGRTR